MNINPFPRRRQAGLPLAALLENYLVRAEAIADAGGGDLWVVEPAMPPELLPDFTEAVTRHLDDHGVLTEGTAVLEGTASARVVVLATTDRELPDVAPADFPSDIDLRPANRTPPAPSEPRPLPQPRPEPATEDVAPVTGV